MSAPPAYQVREETDTSVTFDCFLRNVGDATVTKPLMRVMVLSKNAGMQVSPMGVQRPPDSPSHTGLVALDSMRRNTTMPMLITLIYPKGGPPFTVIFNVDADEIETATPLGFINVTPRKPVN